MSRLRLWPKTHLSGLRAVLGASVLLSLGAIALAGWLHAPEYAGLGGAAAVGLSFLSLFAGRDSAGRAFEQTENGRLAVERAFEEFEPSWTTATAADPAALDAWARRVEDAVADDRRVTAILVETLSPMLGAARSERRYLTFSSVIGTATWAVGEFVARWLCGCS